MVLSLVAGAAWGPCAACPLFAQRETPACCQHHHGSGHCQMPAPKRAPARCPNMALLPAAHHPTQLSASHYVAPAAVTQAIAEPEPAEVFVPAPRSTIIHSPPDLYLLNATLLV